MLTATSQNTTTTNFAGPLFRVHPPTTQTDSSIPIQMRMTHFLVQNDDGFFLQTNVLCGPDFGSKADWYSIRKNPTSPFTPFECTDKSRIM